MATPELRWAPRGYPLLSSATTCAQQAQRLRSGPSLYDDPEFLLAAHAPWLRAPFTCPMNSSGHTIALLPKRRPVHGAWRLIGWEGDVYARVIRNQRRVGRANWPDFGGAFAPATQVLRLVLLALQRHGVPHGLDAVYASSDEDPAPRRLLGGGVPPLLANCAEGESGSVAIPEYTFMGYGGQPPWCVLQEEVQPPPWASRQHAVLFAGNLWRGPHRILLRSAAALSLFSSRGLRIDVHDTGHGANGSRLSIQQHCEYRYLLSLPGAGYANRLKSLLLCGAVVVHVPHASEEWFTPRLKEGVHYLRAASLAEAAERIAQIDARPAAAAAIGRAARAFATGELAWGGVLSSAHAALAAHAAAWPRASPPPRGEWIDPHADDYAPYAAENASGARGFVRLRTPEDVARLMLQLPYGSEACAGWDCAAFARAACTGEPAAPPCRHGAADEPRPAQLRLYAPTDDRRRAIPRLNYFNLSARAKQYFCALRAKQDGKA